MVESILKFLQKLVETDPQLAVLLIAFIAVFYNQEIKEIIRVKILKKDSQDSVLEKKILHIVSTLKYVREFNKEVIALNSSSFKDEILESIDGARMAGRQLVLDLSNVVKINDKTRAALRDALIDSIDKDDVNLVVIFPKCDCTKLYEELVEYSGKRGAGCISVKRDERGYNSVTVDQ